MKTGPSGDPQAPVTLPAAMPNSWIDQIKSAVNQPLDAAKFGSPESSNASLPSAMPEHWVDQIKDVVKSEKTAWMTVMSSAVLAAALTGISSYFVMLRTNSANRELEGLKSSLQVRLQAAQHEVSAYQKLVSEMQNLSDTLDGINVKYENLSGRLRGSVLSSEIHPDLLAAGKAVRRATEALHDQNIQEKDITKQVDSIIGTLSPLIAKAQADIGQLPALLDAYGNAVRSSISKVQQQIVSRSEHITP
jgi:hypothetical protein